MNEEVLIPIIVPTAFFATVFGIMYVRSRENMAMIEKGMNPRLNKVTPRPFISLKYGLLACGAGVGLLLAFLFDNFLLNHQAVTPGGERYMQDFPQIYFALIAIGGGLGLILSYRIEKKEWLHRKEDD